MSQARMPDTPARAIRELRQALGLTQVQLARVMGVSQSDVSQWENRRHPTELYLRIMASLAGTNGKVELKARFMSFVKPNEDRKLRSNAIRHYELQRSGIDSLPSGPELRRGVKDPAIRQAPRYRSLSEMDGERDG